MLVHLNLPTEIKLNIDKLKSLKIPVEANKIKKLSVTSQYVT